MAKNRGTMIHRVYSGDVATGKTPGKERRQPAPNPSASPKCYAVGVQPAAGQKNRVPTDRMYGG